jgi:hypothetical protein
MITYITFKCEFSTKAAQAGNSTIVKAKAAQAGSMIVEAKTAQADTTIVEAKAV